ncbi:serine/threonine-protein phosphatase Stp1 [Rhodobacteraceae bacterium MBR-64]|jgi:serine/threonine protein phosphatase PrpC
MTDGARPIRYSATTHVGRVRQVNEDAILALPDQRIWIVADGMGGHAAGDFASQTVTEAVAMLPADLPPGDLMRQVRGAILDAHDIIRAEAAARGGEVIGTTVVALILSQDHFAALWVGDSRIYRFRNGRAEMLTTDHSLVADLVLAGEMTWDEAEHHPQSNAITRAVGVGTELALDKVHGALEPGDRFLLCSDGLNKYATLAQLEALVPGAPIETLADRLMQLALDGGGADNISVIVVDVG